MRHFFKNKALKIFQRTTFHFSRHFFYQALEILQCISFFWNQAFGNLNISIQFKKLHLHPDLTIHWIWFFLTDDCNKVNSHLFEHFGYSNRLLLLAFSSLFQGKTPSAIQTPKLFEVKSLSSWNFKYLGVYCKKVSKIVHLSVTYTVTLFSDFFLKVMPETGKRKM